MSSAGAPWVAPPTSSNPRSTRKEKKNPRPTLACLPSGAGSRVRDSTSTGPRGLRLVLHESMDAAGIDARQAREAREGFCQQVGRLTKIYSETSIAISRGPDLARAAMLIAAEDESLVSNSSAPLPVDDFIERLDDLSMDFCSLYLPPSSSPPEVFLANLERYIYVHKGFHRTCMMSDATALYLHSVLTCRKGSPIMLSLIYSEILKMLRIYGVLDFDVEIYFPHDQDGLPRGYEKQKSRLSDHPHILTSKSFLVEVLSSLKNAFWPFQNDKSSLFLRAAQAASHAYGPTVSGKSFSKYSHGLDTAAMDSKHIGDMRRTLAGKGHEW
ncbi:hypothetical protein AXF42_Ash009200 [Apostasia shenzhenica]|uniref:Protein SirB1 N-terminal domain-containing protein n=1 Tax=Apostasia shenzhenica TaxID=1088818 RepID=A0A2I0ADT0_9ASPA|nr:hypothetical protein AXF42_Ash009200 [Apostasia shenzhenica]